MIELWYTNDVRNVVGPLKSIKKLSKARGSLNINSVVHFYIAFDKICNPHAVQLFITGAALCAPNGRLASHIS